MQDRKTAVRSVGSDHALQLFDTDETLAEGVASFLERGAREGDALLVVSRSDRWAAIAKRLAGTGVELEALGRSSRLTVRDAQATLDLFVTRGRPDARRFTETVGALVRSVAAPGLRLRVYGEMVDVLAAAGNHRGAELLEALWNRLAETEPFKLFCGYSASSFKDVRHQSWLRAICKAHSHVHSSPRDVLGSQLVSQLARAGA